MDKVIANILIDKIGRETVDKFIEDDKGNLTGVATISLEALAEEIADTLKKQGYGDTKQAVREFAERLKDYDRQVQENGYDGIGEMDIDELLAEVTGE